MTASRPSALPLQQSVDVVVFGPELAGAVAGALLARHGYRVLAVGHGDLSPTYLHGTWVLPRGPALLPSLRHLPVANAVLDELGLSADLTRAQAAPNPPLQILEPGSRLELHALPARRATELRRALGPAGDSDDRAIQALLAWDEESTPFFRDSPPLPADGWLDRMKLRRHVATSAALRSGPRDVPETLPARLQALATVSSYLRAPAGPGLRPLAQLLGGPMITPGGEIGLAGVLRHRMTAAGGSMLEDPQARLAELSSSGRAVVEARTSKGQKIRARQFISALSAHELPDLIPGLERSRRFSERLESVKPRRALMTLNLLLRPKGIPPGMGGIALALPGGRSDRALLIQVGAARSTGTHEPPEQLMSLSAWIDCGALGSPEGSRREAESMKAAAAEFFPFLPPYVALESSYQLEHPNREWIHPEFEVTASQQLGVTGLPARTPFRNLTLAGPEVLPGLGLEGQFLTGVRVAQLVQQAIPKRNLLK